MKQKHRIISYLIFALLFLALIWAYFYFPQFRKFFSPAFLKDYLLNLGVEGYFFFIVLLILSMILPTPNTVIILVGGYVYGLSIGILLSLVGVTLGSLFFFSTVRKFGQPLLEKLVDKHHLLHFNHIFKKRGISAAFISYALPFFPSDSLSMFLGLTKTPYKVFLPLVFCGYIPRLLIITTLGEELATGITWKTFLVGGIAVLFILIALFRVPLRKFFFKELRELEEEVEKVEKELGIVKD